MHFQYSIPLFAYITLILGIGAFLGLGAFLSWISCSLFL